MRLFLKNIILAVLLLLTRQTLLIAQGGADNRVNRGIDRMQEISDDYVVLLSYAFMKDVVDSNQNVTDAELRGLEQYESLFLHSIGGPRTLPVVKDTVLLDSVKKFFENEVNNWQENGRKFFFTTRMLLESSNDIQKTLSSISLSGIAKNLMPSLEKTDNINAYVKIYLDSQTQIKPASRKSDNKQVKGLNHTTRDYLLLGAVVVILLLLIYVFLLKNKMDKLEEGMDRLKNKLSGKAKSSSSIKTAGGVSSNSDQWEINELTKENTNLKSEINSLKQIIKEKENEYLHNKRDKLKKNTISETGGNIQTDSYNSVEPFYLSIPKDIDLFNLENKVAEPNQKTLYRFTGSKIGEFAPYLESVVDLQAPLFSHDSFFQPVCEYQNRPNYSEHKSIRVVKTGKYRIEGNDLIVTEKALVEFIA